MNLMARPLRVEFEGAVYHIMARGNQGRNICLDDGDRRMWVATLRQACGRTGWRIHAWVLMNNHYHLLLETPEANLVSGMKWLQGTFTQRYNARHHKRGHLFQGRYKSVPVDAGQGEYFQTVSTYIHLNPARAKLIRIGEQKLWEYGWSSYPDYRAGKGPEWLIQERVLGSLHLRLGQQQGYEAYLESRVLELGIKAGRAELEAAWQSVRRGWYVGGEEFRQNLLARAREAGKGNRRESIDREVRRAHGQDQAGRMLAWGLESLGMSPETLMDQPKGRLEKQVLAWWLRSQTTVDRRWIAERLGMGYETRVSEAVNVVEGNRTRCVVDLKEKLQAYGN